MSPFRSVDRPGNRTPISWLQARHLPVGRAAQSCQRSVRESNPAFRLTKAVCSRSTYSPRAFTNCSDPGWSRTITFLDVGQVSLPLDHGINLVTEVVAKSTGTRFSTSPVYQFAYPANQVAGPGVAPGKRSL